MEAEEVLKGEGDTAHLVEKLQGVNERYNEKLSDMNIVDKITGKVDKIVPRWLRLPFGDEDDDHVEVAITGQLFDQQKYLDVVTGAAEVV